MFNLFNKNSLATALALLSINSSLMAWDYCEPVCCEPTSCSRLYIGGFGGGIYADSAKMTQLGTAFFTEAAGGPLAVVAEGRTKRFSAGFGGGQIGYEMAPMSLDLGSMNWSLAPAAELEAYFYSHSKKGDLINQTDPLRLPEHDFRNSFKASTTVCIVNAVISVNNFCWGGFVPYVGGGIGAAHINLKKADSLQIDPLEAGTNHFNSRRNDCSWAFAAQAKAGVKYNIFQSFHIFAEYRYLFVDSSNYIFGSTVYPDHAATSPWNIKVHDTNFNAFVVGVQFDL